MTFQNSFYKIYTKEETGCRLNATIQVAAEETKNIYKQAIKTINKEISIPGFRKGKAPEDAVVKKFGQHVEKEWKELLLNSALKATFELTQIYPLSKNSIEKARIEKCSLEEGSVVQITYEHSPIVPTIDFSILKIPPIEQTPVSEERIQEILFEVQRSHASFEDMPERIIEDGDYADVTIDAIDETPPKPIVQDRRFEVAQKRLAPWLYRLLIGKAANDVVEGESEVDDHAEESVKAKFKPTKVRITVHAVKKILLPALTDELAKQSGAESTEDLKQKIHANLEQEAKDEQRQKRIEVVEQELLNHYHFDLPASVVKAEAKHRLESKMQTLSQEELSEEKRISLENEVSQEVEEAIRLYYIVKKITEQGNISITNAELNEELLRHIRQNIHLYGKDMDKDASRELVSRITSSLMQKKAREYALVQALSHQD